MNPEAVDRHARPLPDIGETVWYFPRVGERRRGREKVAAIVTHVDRDNRLLELAIIHEANDMLDQQRVPERVGDDRGWLRIPTADSAEAVETLRAELGEVREALAGLKAFIMGKFDQPPMSVLDMLANVDDRVEVLEKAAEAGSKAAPKRPRGRPAKAKKSPAAKPKPERLEPAAEEPAEPKAAA